MNSMFCVFTNCLLMKSDLANVMTGMLVPLVSGSESEAAVKDAEQQLCSIHSSPLP